MYQLLSRSSERPWASEPANLTPADVRVNHEPLILHMQENRSHLTQGERVIVTAIAGMMMLTSLLPAIRGFWPSAVFMLIAMAGLIFALDRHSKSNPASETLELADGRVRHRDSAGRQAEFPTFWMRLATEGRSATDLRLILHSRDGTIEFGRCLSLDERRAVAPLVAAALSQTRGA